MGWYVPFSGEEARLCLELRDLAVNQASSIMPSWRGTSSKPVSEIGISVYEARFGGLDAPYEPRLRSTMDERAELIFI